MNIVKIKNIKIFSAIILSLFLVKLISDPSLVKEKIKNIISFYSKSKNQSKQIQTQTLYKSKVLFVSPSFIIEKSPTPTSFPNTPNFNFTPLPTSSFLSSITSPTISLEKNLILPTLTLKPSFSCPSYSNEVYDSVSVLVKNNESLSSRRDLTLPSLIPISPTLLLIEGVIVDPDPKVPRFSTVFSPKRIPQFLAAYKAEGEIRGPQSTDVEILELTTNPGESLRFPVTGYNIGSGNGAMVLNASDDKITFKIGREDNVVSGYTLYFEGVCLDKNLETLYQRLNSEGRNNLPAIRIGQIFGWAKTDRLKIALRDTGTFLDLRLVDIKTGESLWK